jgi:1,4-dihydroxy-2-naphthoate octaprenyltransferase
MMSATMRLEPTRETSSVFIRTPGVRDSSRQASCRNSIWRDWALPWWFGVIGIVLGVLYSLGPVKLATLGLGETAVAIAFGVLPVTGAAWLQGAAISTPLILFSIPVSAWVMAILLINEVPDIEADAACGKNTLPVRFGLNSTANLYFAIQFVAALAVIVLTVQGNLPLLAPLAPVGLLALGWKAASGIRGGVEHREVMAKSIEATLGIHTIGCIWLTGCALFSIWF